MARSKRGKRIGEALTWLCGGALALNLLLVVGLLAVLLFNGGSYFWPRALVEVSIADGARILGEVVEREPIPGPDGSLATSTAERMRLKTGNRDVTGLDFVWIEDSAVVEKTVPAGALLLERFEWGNFYGYPVRILRKGTVVADDPAEVRGVLARLLEAKADERERLEELEKGPIGDVNHAIEQLRLERRKIEMRKDLSAEDRARRLEEVDRFVGSRTAEYEDLASQLFALRETYLAESIEMRTADGTVREMPVGQIVRAVAPNELSLLDKTSLYASRAWEFVSAQPRESNTEGGIFPAIFGTVMMVFMMSIFVTPLGVLAAIYLREYAKQGPMIRAVRIAVNNLAGVPSIVFGVFGLGFFVYMIGGTIDQLFYSEMLPSPTFGTGGILWASLTLALLTVPVVIVATEEGLAAVPRIVREGSLALGATKFETTVKVVIPAAAPGILTGMILAMARAAGEVAPLMIVGMVKLAPSLPIDGRAPFVHFERKFMHLGFHIYDVGFQSPNVEATKPLVFATALLLIGVVMAMNIVAIAIRNHLRRKYATSAV